MPVPARAAAAPPPRTSLRVRRTSGAGGLDELEPAHHAVEVRGDLAVRQAQIGNNVLADRVQRSVVLPGVEEVPRVGAPVDGVALDLELAHRRLTPRVAEAGTTVAIGDGRAARIPAQIHVDFADAALEPDEPHQVTPVPLDRIGAVPLALELARQRRRKPARAVNGRADPVGKLLPRRLPGRGTGG